MDFTDAVKLIEKGVDRSSSQNWLDLGAGNGLFTEALAHVLEKPSEITAVDLTLSKQLESFAHPRHKIKLLRSDFTLTKVLPSDVDGILMANALHFVKEKESFLTSLCDLLKPDGRVIIIEYDLHKPNPWVPYPILREECIALLTHCGFISASTIAERKSTLNNALIYSLFCVKR